MIQKHFLNPTRFYMLFIDIRVTLVINIINLRPLYMYNIFFQKIYFHMRKNQQKNTTNKTMYKRQSKE